MAGAFLAAGCDDLFEPAIENHPDIEQQMHDDPEYARGILHNVYSMLPSCYDNSEYATDDAVTNQSSNVFLQMATGAWTNTSYNPLSQWNNAYNALQYINLFLENVDEVRWSQDDPEMDALFARRLKGEAYGLRGMYYYYLLRAHAGFTAEGELLGVPLINEYLTTTSDFNIPRATYQQCLEQVYSDLSQAEQLLPWEYNDVSAVPEGFQDLTTDASKYNNVMGAKARQLFNGLIARAFRTRMALLAASPLYQDPSNNATWEDAANAAADIIDYKGGVGGLANDGLEYYSPSIVNSADDGNNPAEILWRSGRSSNNTQESQNFPPSLYGTGYMNPSQNLVDAFPMANGYPIDHSAGNYNEVAPYANRDPRLAKYIIYNGSTINEKGVTINIVNSSTDGINVTENRSTRTGYYMRKRLRMDVNCNPAATSNQPHYDPRIRFTEMYLAFAEAANEAWGPKDARRGYSAYDVIKKIRQRAGVGGTDDPYLEECAASKERMRALIHNERRLEMCFESVRFWDLRRWKENLNEPVYGLQWNGNGYERILVEERSYEDYMYYSPVPNSEILKFSNLKQNRGWE